jgi:hypothetical protein
VPRGAVEEVTGSVYGRAEARGLGHSRGMSSEKFWFNVRTRQVEQGPQSLSTDRLGPYDTHDEAARALEKARRRAEAWAREEEQEDEWGAPTGGAPTGVDLEALAEEGERES